jgi:hypothetical protein
MDDTERKIIPQLDDPMPGQRANALEILHKHHEQTKGSFRDIIFELDEANKLLNLYWVENRALASLLWVKGKWRRHWRGICASAAVASAAWFGFGWITGETSVERQAINSGLAGVLDHASFGLGDSKPDVYYYAGGKPFWGVIRGEVVTGSHVDQHGQPVTLSCLHMYAAPATADWQSYLRPNPYNLAGWVRWPERATLCKPTAQTAAADPHDAPKAFSSNKSR